MLISSHVSAQEQRLDLPDTLTQLHQQYDSIKFTQLQEALNLAIEMNGLADSSSHLSTKAQALYDLGFSYFRVGNNGQAKLSLDSALKYYQVLNDTLGQCLSLNWIGNVLKAMNDKEAALENYKVAMDLAKAAHLTDEVNRIEHNIGIIYLENGHYSKAIECFERSASNSSNLREKAIAMANIGLSYQRTEEFELAKQYYQKSMYYCAQLDSKECEVVALEGFAGIALEQGNYDDALMYTQAIRNYQESQNLAQSLFITYNRLGLIYDAKGELNNSVRYFHKGIRIADSLQSELLPYLYANLANAYENAGKYDRALDYSNIFHDKKDSIDKQKDQLALEELLAQFELEKKEQEIDMLKKTGELQDSLLESRQNEIKRQEYIRNLIIASSLLVAALAFFAFKSYQLKIKEREALALKNEELNKQQTLELLREYELKTIKAFVDGQEKEKIRVAQDLHDNIAGTLAAIKMKLQKAFTTNSLASSNELLTQIDHVYNEVRTLSHHLTPDKAVIGSYSSFLENYIDNIQSADSFQTHLILDGEEYIHLLTDSIKIEVYRIIQEATQNVIKHAHAKNLEVQLLISEELVNLIIEDDGDGFSSENQPSGIGLRNMKTRVQKLSGTFHLDTYPQRGTIINIDIPLSQPANQQNHEDN